MLREQEAFVLFTVLGFVTQVGLVSFFAARRWWRSVADRYGWLVYAVGAPALIIGVLLLTSSLSWSLATGPLLFGVWAAFGYQVDIRRPVSWRNPPRWSILVPYVTLLWISLFGLWMPLWNIGLAYWIAFGVMLAIHTTLNISGHSKSG